MLCRSLPCNCWKKPLCHSSQTLEYVEWTMPTKGMCTASSWSQVPGHKPSSTLNTLPNLQGKGTVLTSRRFPPVESVLCPKIRFKLTDVSCLAIAKDGNGLFGLSGTVLNCSFSLPSVPSTRFRFTRHHDCREREWSRNRTVQVPIRSIARQPQCLVSPKNGGCQSSPLPCAICQ